MIKASDAFGCCCRIRANAKARAASLMSMARRSLAAPVIRRIASSCFSWIEGFVSKGVIPDPHYTRLL